MPDSNVTRVRLAESRAADEGVFFAVLQVYRDIRELPGLAAVSADPQSMRAKTLTAICVEFRIDVERATERVLTDKAQQQAWFRLLTGEEVEPALAQKVITLCGRRYRSLRLTPTTYFRRQRVNVAKGKPWLD